MLRETSDTAFLIAYQRALESEALDPLVRDPYARALAGERGRLAAHALPTELRDAWAIGVRTRVYDEMILSAVTSAAVDAVLNLGAGLDTRPYRLALPRTLSWIEADLPFVIDHKTSILSHDVPSCAVKRFKVDLADETARRSLFERTAREHERVFVLTEGVLAYLEEGSVSALATELRSCGAVALWAAEVVSPRVLTLQPGTINALRAVKMELKFAPDRGVEFFVDRGWAPRRALSLFEEAHRLRRGPALTPEARKAIRNAFACLLLEPAGSTI